MITDSPDILAEIITDFINGVGILKMFIPVRAYVRV